MKGASYAAAKPDADFPVQQAPYAQPERGLASPQQCLKTGAPLQLVTLIWASRRQMGPAAEWKVRVPAFYVALGV